MQTNSNMKVIKYRKIFFIISSILVVGALVSIFTFGLRPGVEFAGGTIVEVSFNEEAYVEKGTLEAELAEVLPDRSISVQETGETGYLVRSEFLSEEDQNAVIGLFSDEGETVERISAIGPSIGSELKTRASIAIVVVVLIIILFIAYAFRKVSEPVSSWRYGFVAIAALIHDTLIPTGAFAILGAYLGYEVDVLFVMALLAILGYSVNDTIVVFDRIRENLALNAEKNKKEDFKEVVGRSLEQTYSRSLNTSLTTILVLLALYFFGATSTEHFALTLLIGAIAGTYSSIFLASPLLVWIEERQRKG